LVQFSLNAPFPGSPGRAGGAAGLRHDQGARDQVLKPAQGLTAIAFLGAMIARHDQNLARVDQAVAGGGPQRQLRALIEEAACRQVEAQLRGVATLLTFWPPGPAARTKLREYSLSEYARRRSGVASVPEAGALRAASPGS